MKYYIGYKNNNGYIELYFKNKETNEIKKERLMFS